MNNKDPKFSLEQRFFISLFFNAVITGMIIDIYDNWDKNKILGSKGKK